MKFDTNTAAPVIDNSVCSGAEVGLPSFHQRGGSADSTQSSLQFSGSSHIVDKPVQGDDPHDGQETNTLNMYLLSQFNRKAFADCCLRLSHHDGKFETTEYFLHGLLIARSPKLENLMRSATIDGSGRMLLRLDTDNDFLRPKAFELALQHLYGQSLLTHDLLAGSNSPIAATPYQVSDDEARLEFATAYAAAGDILQILGVMQGGYDIISKLISLETFEKTFAFAMDGGRSKDKAFGNSGSPSNTSAPTYSPMNITVLPASQNNVNREGSSGGHIQHEPEGGSTAAATTHEQCADGLLRNLTQLVVNNLTPDFELQLPVTSLPNIDRRPVTAEIRPSTSHGRLGRIQFGSMPVEDAARPDPRSVMLSEILISIPSSQLEVTLGALDPSAQARLGPRIFRERKWRRHRAQK